MAKIRKQHFTVNNKFTIVQHDGKVSGGLLRTDFNNNV